MNLPKKLSSTPRVASVQRYAEADVPTERGMLRMVVYREPIEGAPADTKEHVALIVGRPENAEGPVLARMHSECLTSEVFGSLKCDCRDQLDAALDRCFDKGVGVVLYLRQEGRGIGLGNKIRAYALQSEGADTVQANHQLGFDTDLRRYDVAADMFLDLQVKSVRLMTNNPDKVAQLEDYGVKVEGREPHQTPANIHSRKYMATKREKCGHFIRPID